MQGVINPENPGIKCRFYVSRRRLNIRRLGEVLPSFQVPKRVLTFLANNRHCIGPQWKRTWPWFVLRIVLSFHNVDYALNSLHSITGLVSIEIVELLSHSLRNGSVIINLGYSPAA